ncbi:ABC transporter substrate-binding protein [Paenibacillus sp. GCM10027627]|uniref:ABC transporter substrate-binding protein n=1 Tax=unclassified Paenibacillus TaxID=185978 RepID=UPI003630DB4F
MKKQWTVLLCVMLLAVSVLGACSSSSSSKGTNSPASPEATNGTDSPSKEKVTIKYFNWDNEVQAQTTAKYIEQFEAENPNIKVESVALVPGNSLETMKKLDFLVASGEQVDLIAFPNTTELFTRAQNGVLAPLNEFYTADGIKPDEEYMVNPKMKDNYYGIQTNATTNFILLNKDALDAAGLAVPKADWTWDDFREYAKKLTTDQNGTKQYGAYFHSWPLYMNPVAQVNMRHPFLTEEGKTNFSDPSFKSFFDLRRAMEKEDKSAKPYSDVIGAKLAYRTEFFDGKAAMMLTGSWMISEIGDTTKYPHTFKTAVAPVPLPSKGADPSVYIGGNFLSVGETSKYKQEAYKFARFISTNLSEARIELPGWRKGDAKPIVERMIGENKELYDVDSLMYTLFTDEIKPLPASSVVVSYDKELDQILTDGFSKFILGSQSSDEIQAWMVDEANKVIQKNTK